MFQGLPDSMSNSFTSPVHWHAQLEGGEMGYGLVGNTGGCTLGSYASLQVPHPNGPHPTILLDGCMQAGTTQEGSHCGWHLTSQHAIDQLGQSSKCLVSSVWGRLEGSFHMLRPQA